MFPLAPLALPDPGEGDPARAARSAAVALFAARARARDPQFELTPEVTVAVAEICRRLDGLPLAIELAAARTAVLPAPAMLARWDAAIGLDAPGARDLPKRQQTLRRAFDWSYELLGDEERALLRRLAAFPGGFDIAAVEAACDGDGDILPALAVEPIETLAGFVDRSLVSRDPRASTSEPRYAQLMTVRAYLREQLVRHGEDAAADLLMAAACQASAHRAGQFFAGGRSREELDRLERELHNMRAALDALVRVAPARAVDLAVDLTGLWETRHVSEGRAWVQRALAAGGDELAPATRASGLWTAAMLAHYQGDYEAERPLAVASLAAARVADDPLTLARALYIEALSVVTDAPGATARYREVLALCERLGDDAGIAMACNDLGELARGAGALDEARALYERALALWRAATRAASPVRPTISGRRCSLAASSTAPPRCSWSRSRRRGASAIAVRTPRRWRAWRRWRRTGAERRRRDAARRGAGGGRRRRGRTRPDRRGAVSRCGVGAARGAGRRAFHRGGRARAGAERRRAPAPCGAPGGRRAAAALRRAHPA